jgi:hypothetical protein
MVANCDVLISEWSTLVFVALALGKECYSYHDMRMVERLAPIQNGGTSAENVAAVCRPAWRASLSRTLEAMR